MLNTSPAQQWMANAAAAASHSDCQLGGSSEDAASKPMKTTMPVTASACLRGSDQGSKARASRPPAIQAKPISSASAPVVVAGRW